MRSTFAFLVTIITLVLAIGYISQSVPTAYAASQEFALRGARSSGWNSTNPGPTLYVTKGDTLTANLVSADGLPHTFVIDAAQAGITPTPNCSVDKCSSRFSSATTFMFTADLQPGSYTYFCSIHLAAMKGSIVVQSSASTPDFTATSNPADLTIAPGSSGSVTVTVTSLNGFSGSVSLTATVNPTGPQVSLSSQTITLSPSGSGSTTLTVSTSVGVYSTPVSLGAYTVTVVGSSGSLSHSTAIPLNIGSTSPGSGSSMSAYFAGISGTILLGGAVAVLAVVAVTIVAVAARRRMKP